VKYPSIDHDAELSEEEFRLLRDFVHERFGLYFDESQRGSLRSRLAPRLALLGLLSFEDYYRHLRFAPERSEEQQRMVSHLTNNETYFFREQPQLEVFSTRVLRAIKEQKARTGEKRLHVLSAGCSTGEEPLTLGMILFDSGQFFWGWDVRVTGLDVDGAALEKARRGAYHQNSLRAVTPPLLERHFVKDGSGLRVKEASRKAVSFRAGNLLDPASYAGLAPLDVVFCRNVLIYFSDAAVQRAVSLFHEALAPGGYLFLGHAETLRGLSQDFHLRQAFGSFFYQRREEGEPLETAWTAGAAEASSVPRTLEMALAPDPGTSWIDAIQRASERIAALVGAHVEAGKPAATARAAAPVAPTTEPAPTRAAGLDPALALFRDGRFAEALDRLHSLPPPAAADPDALLLRAAILVNRGEVDEARQACAAVLAADEFNAGAHYLLALCREHAGDRDGAASHDRTAVYLDPDFAMPHLHLGLLSRRAGDVEAGRRELREALDRLAREDAARILLFGGGFGREALMRLCCDGLRACGGPS